MGERCNVIFVNGYRRDVEIGVFEEEYGAPQGLVFDIELAVSVRPESDDADEVISYDTLVEAIEAVAAGPRLQLVETFAERVAERCLADPRAVEVTITVAKLDRLAEGATLGVRIVRRREA